MTVAVRPLPLPPGGSVRHAQSKRRSKRSKSGKRKRSSGDKDKKRKKRSKGDKAKAKASLTAGESFGKYGIIREVRRGVGSAGDGGGSAGWWWSLVGSGRVWSDEVVGLGGARCLRAHLGEDLSSSACGQVNLEATCHGQLRK